MTAIPSKLRVSDMMASASEAASPPMKVRWTEGMPSPNKPMGRDARKRYILGAACIAFFLVIVYANTNVANKKAKLMLEWQEGVQKQQSKAAQKQIKTLSAAATTSSTQPAEGSVNIPRIIHQTWTSSDRMLPQFADFTKTWKERYPGWNYKFWSDDDNNELVREHYPWLLPFYNTLPHPSHRADIAKYLYMHKFGGIFAGISTYCVRAFNDSQLNATPVTLAATVSESGQKGVTGAFLASQPGQPFFHFVVTKAVSYADEGQPLSQRSRVEVTGSGLLHRAAHHYRLFHGDGQHNVTVLDAALVVDGSMAALTADAVGGSSKPCVLAPVANFDSVACAQQFPSAHVFVTGASARAAADAGSSALLTQIVQGTTAGSVEEKAAEQNTSAR